MKKKILFVLESYRIGGTTVSTRNLIGVLEKTNKYSIFLFSLNNEGLLKDIYKDCNTVKTCFLAHALMMQSYKEGKNIFFKFVAMGIRFLRNHSPSIKKYFYSYIEKRCLKNLRFDTIVACAEGKTTDFLSYINHDNKIAWVRCDYANYYTELQINQKRDQYKTFKHIVCVSERTMEGFKSVYPEYANKIVSIYNPQDEALLHKLASIDDNDYRFITNKKIIVSVGRIDKIKRFSHIPTIVVSLIKMGLDFTWYIVGDGDKNELNLIKGEIQKNHVENTVILLGAKSNAHFYIKNADLLVVTSLSEACPRVINEAKILKTPVVSTDFRTIYEYIENGKNGIISNISVIDKEIYRILSDNELYNNISNEISSFSFDNTELITKIQSIL